MLDDGSMMPANIMLDFTRNTTIRQSSPKTYEVRQTACALFNSSHSLARQFDTRTRYMSRLCLQNGTAIDFRDTALITSFHRYATAAYKCK